MDNESKTSTNRIAWIDLAKGMGVMLVILGHMDLGDGITSFLYSFHMPLFFFLSGMVFRVREGERFGTFAVRKARALLIPYLLLGIPLLFSEYTKEIYAGTFSARSALDWIAKMILQQRLWTIWFLTALFLLELLMYWITAIREIKYAAGARLLLSALLSAAGIAYCVFNGRILAWDADMALCAALWFDAGYELQHAGMDRRVGGAAKGKLLAAVVLGLAVNLLCSFFSKETSGQTLMMSYNSYGQPVLTYLGAFGGICMTIALAVLLHGLFQKANCHPLTYIGRNTWIYFAWNQTMLLPLINWILNRVGFAAGACFSWGWWCHRLIELLFVLAASTLLTGLWKGGPRWSSRR